MLDFPLPDKPESINHGSADGFNFGGSLGFVYEAMGVHSSVICGKKQVEDVGRDEMVSCSVLSGVQQQGKLHQLHDHQRHISCIMRTPAVCIRVSAEMLVAQSACEKRLSADVSDLAGVHRCVLILERHA